MKNAKAKLEFIEWCDLWVTGANPADERPRVLMVGDSITRSYFEKVEKILGDRFYCARLTTSRCVCDPKFKKELALLVKEFRFSAIHFNNGLHGWDFSEPAYAKGLARTMDYLIRQSNGAKVIWGTITPVWVAGQPGALDSRTDRVRERNRLALDLATRHNLPVNELFGQVIDHPEYFMEDGVHFNGQGQEVLAREVAKAILQDMGFHDRA